MSTNIFTSSVIESISAEALKWIARLSDFNVDLQCKRGLSPSYRAICGKCQEYMELDQLSVHHISVGQTEPYKGLEKFLVNHRHEVEVKESVGGRKFRNASIA